jgi:hypothetical protein
MSLLTIFPNPDHPPHYFFELSDIVTFSTQKYINNFQISDHFGTNALACFKLTKMVVKMLATVIFFGFVTCTLAASTNNEKQAFVSTLLSNDFLLAARVLGKSFKFGDFL